MVSSLASIIPFKFHRHPNKTEKTSPDEKKKIQKEKKILNGKFFAIFIQSRAEVFSFFVVKFEIGITKEKSSKMKIQSTLMLVIEGYITLIHLRSLEYNETKLGGKFAIPLRIKHA